MNRVPVTLHVLSFIQGHHTNHSTAFVLTSEGGNPDRPEDVISRITYPIVGIPSIGMIRAVGAEMDTVLSWPPTEHASKGWIDHISYNGHRLESD